ncbi:hypothetical protein [Sodalis ligni]|uniref:Pectate lyase superfamily protein domain-containing protein n=1 Tax=Sodalis ligni TaxID=2697027 RepID=A0A4R1NI68_9GAMM|nr:hypothetical protein [Sodalis ligni]TCL07342.1 hypothetical protein EZJ58_5661 [Sodalis ligni]
MNNERRHILKMLPLALLPSALSAGRAFSAEEAVHAPMNVNLNDKSQAKERQGVTEPVVKELNSDAISYRSKFDTTSRSLDSKLSDTVSILDVGGSHTSDNHDAFMNAVKQKVGCLYIPPGTWPYSGLINTGSMRIIGTGPYPGGSGSQLLAMDKSAVFRVGSGAYLSGLLFDGNGLGSTDGKGEYGIIFPYAQCMLAENVHVRHFKKYGIILDRAQNSALIKVNAQFNGVNFLLNNGARNMVLLGCNGALDIHKERGRRAEHRNILMTHIQDDALLSVKPIGQSNSRIQIIGGIYEYANYADSNIEIAHAGTHGFNDILMQGVEITEALASGYLINLTRGSLKVDNCEFNGRDNAKTIYVGEHSSLTIPADGSFGSGGRGKLAALYGLDIAPGGNLVTGRPGDGLPTASNMADKGTTNGWRPFGNATTKVEWLPVLRSVQVTSQELGHGAKMNFVVRPSVVPQGTLINFTGDVEIIENQTLNLVILLKNKTSRIIQENIGRSFNVYYRMTGDETNIIAIISSGKSNVSQRFLINIFSAYIH